jgi:hypothetical protein
VRALALAMALQAAASAPAPASNVSPPVVVTAPALLKNVPALVHSFARRPADADQLARWQVALCPAVIGPPADQVAYLIGRLRDTAKTTGVPVGRPDCVPNLIVVLTPNLDEMTAAIVKRGARVLGPGSGFLQYSGERAQFLRHDSRPYHEFAMTTEVLASHGSGDGDMLQVSDLSDSSAALEGSGLSFTGMNGPPVIAHAPDSYMTPDVGDSFSRLVLVVDQTRLAGLNLQQISAYVLMLSFAQVDDEADKTVDTILQVTDPTVPASQKPQDLTIWDRAYLGALYRSATQKSLRLQEGVIETEITNSVKNQTLLPRHVGLDVPSHPRP